MNPQIKKNFDHPDETRPIKKGKVEVLNMGPGLRAAATLGDFLQAIGNQIDQNPDTA